MLHFCMYALILSGVSGVSFEKESARRRGREGSAAGGVVRKLEFKHQLRVCNAYPYNGALDVYRGSEKLTGDDPMPYKVCRDFHSPLFGGDKLVFKVGDISAGAFSVSDLPSNDAVLLLVIHRHDTLSTAASFESHVFASLENPQVAIIDTYKGGAKSVPRILDAEVPGNKTKAHRSEELRYESVVAVNPGKYEVELQDNLGSTKVENPFVALPRESYVVMRVGVEAHQGESFPQELVVFPESDASLLPHSAAVRAGLQALFLAAATALALGRL